NGRPLTVPEQDMVLGIHYLTKLRQGLKGEGILFSSIAEVMNAFQCESVHLHARIKVRLPDNVIVETTTGRVILYDALPEGTPFNLINKIVKKSDLNGLIERVYYKFGKDETVKCLDRVKRLGFHYSTISGISLSIADLVVPAEKDPIIEKAEKEVEKIE